MSDGLAPVGGEGAEPIAVITPASDTGTNLSISEAARALASARHKPKEKEPAAPVEAAAAEPELAETPDDAQPEAVDPVEPTEEAEPEKTPPIEPPRSWTKEAKERWESLPRETQEYLATREQDREREFRRSQNEAAEQRKAIEAERGKAEQVRQQYEAALPALLQTLQEQQQGEFSDIKTMSDVEKLAREDWPRYALWDAQQKKIAAVSSEVRAAQDRQVNDYKTKFQEYGTEQDKKLLDAMPEFADESKQKQIADSVVKTAERVGFTRDELGKAWTGEASVSLRDHRMQQIMIKAALYDQAKTAVKPALKPVPAVQRPGVAKPAGSAQSEVIQALQSKLERSGSLRDAQALRAAQLRRRA